MILSGGGRKPSRQMSEFKGTATSSDENSGEVRWEMWRTEDDFWPVQCSECSLKVVEQKTDVFVS